MSELIQIEEEASPETQIKEPTVLGDNWKDEEINWRTIMGSADGIGVRFDENIVTPSANA